jgi:hypothetical protein
MVVRASPKEEPKEKRKKQFSFSPAKVPFSLNEKSFLHSYQKSQKH